VWPAAAALMLGPASFAVAQEIVLPAVTFGVSGDDTTNVATAVKILLGLTVLSLAPAFLIAMTSFTRIVIVLSILRHAFGMQQTPPNTVLVSLALFLTAFNMLPTFEAAYESAYAPYMRNELATDAALQQGLAPFREFMASQIHEQDLALMVELAGEQMPTTLAEVKTIHLVPAFLLSELKTAFQIGVILFLPFLLVDIVVASILMSMGMLMVPPMMISLPVKILMFVLIDGWNLVVRSLLASFN
jgi:flagellar biosynthetic protein FliP